MTKEDYLIKLKEVLKNSSVKDGDQIIEKYKKRFDLAKEAGFSEEEAISKFGSPEEAGAKEAEESKAKEEEQTKKKQPQTGFSGKWNLVFSLVADNISFEAADNLKDPYIDFNGANPDDYTIENHDGFYKLEFTPKIRNLANIHRYSIRVNLPSSMLIGSLHINTVSSKAVIKSITADDFTYQLVSGSFDCAEFNVLKSSFNNVSGHVNIGSLNGEVLKYNTVTGSMDIDKANVEKISLSSLSGSINVKSGKVVTCSANALSGKINIGK